MMKGYTSKLFNSCQDLPNVNKDVNVLFSISKDGYRAPKSYFYAQEELLLSCGIATMLRKSAECIFDS